MCNPLFNFIHHVIYKTITFIAPIIIKYNNIFVRRLENLFKYILIRILYTLESYFIKVCFFPSIRFVFSIKNYMIYTFSRSAYSNSLSPKSSISSSNFFSFSGLFTKYQQV